jgi:hypothetical protein
MDEQEVNDKLIPFQTKYQDLFSKPNACRTETRAGNVKQMSKIIGLPNQILKFVFQTKNMQDMDEQKANAKLVLGTITFPNQMHAGHG